MMTRHGTIVTPSTGTPSIGDIALSLSRMPRFGGHSIEPWTVADHSVFAVRLAEFTSHAERLTLLLHDAHEALTGDIPTTFKTDDMRRLQWTLDGRIYARHHPDGASVIATHAKLVHEIDRRALLAEARLVGPSANAQSRQFIEWFGAEPDPDDLGALYRMRGELGSVTPAMFSSLYYELRFEHNGYSFEAPPIQEPGVVVGVAGR